jgi:hypothetical protein
MLELGSTAHMSGAMHLVFSSEVYSTRMMNDPAIPVRPMTLRSRTNMAIDWASRTIVMPPPSKVRFGP